MNLGPATVSSLAGGGTGTTAADWADGIGSSALFSAPTGLVANADQTTLYVADTGTGHIRVVDLSSAAVSTLGGGGLSAASIALSWDDVGTSALFAMPSAPVQLAVDGLALYIASQDRVRRISLAGAVASTLAGAGLSTSVAGSADGTGTNAGFSTPSGLALDSAGYLDVADAGSSAIRQVLSACGGGGARVRTLAGGGGTGTDAGTATAARFNTPLGIAVLTAPSAACGGSNGSLLVADTTNNLLRFVNVVPL